MDRQDNDATHQDALPAADVQALVDAAIAEHIQRVQIAEEEREEALLLLAAAEVAKNELKTKHDKDGGDDLPIDEPPTRNLEAITSLNSTQLLALATDLVPGQVEQWVVLSSSALAKKTPLWGKYWLKREETSMDDFLERLKDDATFAAQDEHNAGMIMAMLNGKSVNVTNFKTEMIKLDKTRRAEGKPPIIDSAWLLYNHIEENAQCGVGMKRAARIKDFKANPYFGGAMTTEQFTAAANAMSNDFMLLPESERKDEYAVYRALLAKMPPSMDIKVKEYEYKITKSETLGKPFKWSIDELVQILAIDYGEATVEMTGRAGKSSFDKTKGCSVCGDPNHHAGQRDERGKLICKAYCGGCGERNCAAALGDASKCMLKLSTLPSQTEYKNAAGKTVPAHIFEYMAKKHAERRLTNKSATVGTGTDEDDGELNMSTATVFTML